MSDGASIGFLGEMNLQPLIFAIVVFCKADAILQSAGLLKSGLSASDSHDFSASCLRPVRISHSGDMDEPLARIVLGSVADAPGVSIRARRLAAT